MGAGAGDGAGAGFGEGIPGEGVAGFAKLAGFAAGALCGAAGFGSAVAFNCCLTLLGWAGICCARKPEADKIRRTAAAASMPVRGLGPLRCSMFGSILTVSVGIFIFVYLAFATVLADTGTTCAGICEAGVV